jgi:hypothetical protein
MLHGVVIPQELTFAIYPHTKLQFGQVIDRLGTVSAQGSTAKAKDSALAGLTRRQADVEAGVNAPGLEWSHQGNQQCSHQPCSVGMLSRTWATKLSRLGADSPSHAPVVSITRRSRFSP